MIVRTPNRERFATIDKTGLEDARLSFKARGLLAFLLSKPDSWEVYTAYLVKSSERDGRDSVVAGLKELEDSGYIRRARGRKSDGTWDGTDVTVFETPQPENPVTVTADGLSGHGLSGHGKSAQSEELIPLIDDGSPLTPTSSAPGGKRPARRGMRGTGTSPREIRGADEAAADQRAVEEANEAELDRLVEALPVTYACCSEQIMLEKIDAAFAADDEWRRREALENHRRLRAEPDSESSQTEVAS